MKIHKIIDTPENKAFHSLERKENLGESIRWL